jgi:hypothetical protein
VAKRGKERWEVWELTGIVGAVLCGVGVEVALGVFGEFV